MFYNIYFGFELLSYALFRIDVLLATGGLLLFRYLQLPFVWRRREGRRHIITAFENLFKLIYQFRQAIL